MSLPPLLTLKEVADHLKVHPQTIRNWTKAGTLTPVLKQGRVIRYDWARVVQELNLATHSARHPAFEEIPR